MFISYEYGPYAYQFDHASKQRTRTFALPNTFAISTLSSSGAAGIANNTANGRITNRGMQGLGIKPEGKSLVGIKQSPLAQHGGDGAQANRIAKIDIATGTVAHFAHDISIGSKNYKRSEIVALDDHEFLVLEPDGKDLADG